MDLKKKISTILAFAVFLWILCPLPEVSIVVSLITGESVTRMFDIPSYSRWVIIAVTVPVGWYIFDRIDILDKDREPEYLRA